MSAPLELKGKDAEIYIGDKFLGATELTLSGKTGTVSQDRIGNKYPRTSAGSTTYSLKFTNLDISGEHLAMAVATGAVASTRTVIDACDTSANFYKSGTNAANSAISLDTSNKKKGTGCVVVTNTGDASGNRIDISGNWNLTGHGLLTAFVRASNVGANVIASVGMGEVASTEQTKTATIHTANTWQTLTWDISAIVDASKDALTKVGFLLGSDSSANSIMIDEVVAYKGVSLGTPDYFNVWVTMTDPVDETKFIKYFLPDCYFTDFDISIPGGADKVIEGPISGGIKDASKIQMFYS